MLTPGYAGPDVQLARITSPYGYFHLSVSIWGRDLGGTETRNIKGLSVEISMANGEKEYLPNGGQDIKGLSVEMSMMSIGISTEFMNSKESTSRYSIYHSYQELCQWNLKFVKRILLVVSNQTLGMLTDFAGYLTTAQDTLVLCLGREKYEKENRLCAYL